jgi:hypothetical protein
MSGMLLRITMLVGGVPGTLRTVSSRNHQRDVTGQYKGQFRYL